MTPVGRAAIAAPAPGSQADTSGNHAGALGVAVIVCDYMIEEEAAWPDGSRGSGTSSIVFASFSAQGGPLEKLAATVDFEIFRPDLAAALGPRDRSKGGRPGFDPV